MSDLPESTEVNPQFHGQLVDRLLWAALIRDSPGAAIWNTIRRWADGFGLVLCCCQQQDDAPDNFIECHSR